MLKKLKMTYNTHQKISENISSFYFWNYTLIYVKKKMKFWEELRNWFIGKEKYLYWIRIKTEQDINSTI